MDGTVELACPSGDIIAFILATSRRSTYSWNGAFTILVCVGGFFPVCVDGMHAGMCWWYGMVMVQLLVCVYGTASVQLFVMCWWYKVQLLVVCCTGLFVPSKSCHSLLFVPPIGGVLSHIVVINQKISITDTRCWCFPNWFQVDYFHNFHFPGIIGWTRNAILPHGLDFCAEPW